MIRFEHVTKKYRGTNKPALSDVDFDVQRGEFVFLVGASGSGKSSCLRLILREDTPSEGRVVVLGRDLHTLSTRKVPYFRRHIGSVFQDFRLLPNKTVFQNVAFTLQVIGSSRAYIHQAVTEALTLVGLDGKQKRLPHELSGGEQQRVAIARAIVNRPQILLADEPTGNLDPATSIDIMQLLARINEGGTTVVMATHEAGFVDQMKRRVIELQSGVMVRDDRHGGYGDRSSLPTLAPQEEKGAAATAALTAVLELQREIAASTVEGVAPAAAAAVSEAASDAVAASAVAAAVAVTPELVTSELADRETAPAVTREPAAPPVTRERPAPVEAQPADGATAEPAPHTRPIRIDAPAVDLDGLDLDGPGVADRLGLASDDDEVGPTS
ncbi:cell division ATP-binding protein FtsE [Microbacterium lacticum]|uniref:cell division ATP-binding protein FtsE n=1 Tax=Microbacterium lacticum TaxID=33885 RepID=UPI001F574596|nr:cell division ATP-binding protein FtsE [Microbacterium lacticum]